MVTVEGHRDRIICRLDTGLELPVSRTCRARLRAAFASHDDRRVLEAAQRLALVAIQAG
jgi:hypothetical protein